MLHGVECRWQWGVSIISKFLVVSSYFCTSCRVFVLKPAILVRFERPSLIRGEGIHLYLSPPYIAVSPAIPCPRPCCLLMAMAFYKVGGY